MFESYYFAKGKEASAKLRAKTVIEHTSKMGDYYYNVGVQDFTAGLSFIKEIENQSNVYAETPFGELEISVADLRQLDFSE